MNDRIDLKKISSTSKINRNDKSEDELKIYNFTNKLITQSSNYNTKINNTDFSEY